MRKLTALILCIALVCCLTVSTAEEEPDYASYALLDTDELPPELGERKLTDDQIAALGNASPEQLRKKLSTFPDYIAWVNTLTGPYCSSVTSDDNWQITMDPLFDYRWMNSTLSTNALVSLAQYFLDDDYPGMGTVMAVLVSSSGHDWIYANTFPVEDGYLVLCAGSYSEYIQSQTDWGMNVIEPLQTDDLTGIISFCNSYDLKWGSDKALSQLLYFDSTEGLVMNWNSPFYVPTDDAHVKTLFSDPDALYPTDPLILVSYRLPEEIGTSSDLDSATCRALSKASLQELAEAIKSVPDLLTYMHYAAFSKYDGDITQPLQDMEWHFNYSPEVVFSRNAGNCGATAGFAEYLLQGDYDEVGIIGLTYEDGMGGHVINYIRQGGKYYVMDFNSWITDNHVPSSLHFKDSNSLADAAKKYTWDVSGVALMYAYQTGFGDAPIGWVGTDVSYIMQDYAQNVQILLENPPYRYEVVEEKDEIKQLIRLRQNAW